MKSGVPFLVYIDKIWDYAPHNAFTDLIRFHDSWFLIFRESDSHASGSNGVIRLLTSHDAIIWQPAFKFQELGIDLRDPKLSVTPDGRLMVLMGGTLNDVEGDYISHQSRVSFSSDGYNWEPPVAILRPHEWLWRITWHQGKAYGVSYRFSDPLNLHSEWLTTLYESEDGVNYQRITNFNVVGYPNETTLRFLPDQKMVALLRRDKPFDSSAWIGVSEPPYEEWSWKSTKYHFGGPNFIVLSNGQMWASGRIVSTTPYGVHERTVLARLTENELQPVMVVHSGGDTSYPGMVFFEGHLWLSYYSSHEGFGAIYLAKIQLPFD